MLGGDGMLELFYFSIETLATVGYGDMHPQTEYGHFIATVEIFTGMCFLAVMTGLIFARFSRPRARFVFADYPVVSSRRRQADADDPHGQRPAQHDLPGERAALDHSRRTHQGRRPAAPLLRAEARPPGTSDVRIELDALSRHRQGQRPCMDRPPAILSRPRRCWCSMSAASTTRRRSSSTPGGSTPRTTSAGSIAIGYHQRFSRRALHARLHQIPRYGGGRGVIVSSFRGGPKDRTRNP